jgi:hypothetical protein
MIPQCETDSKWLFEKIGSMIAPTDVVLNGGRNLHGVWEKIVCKGTKNIQIETLDSLLVSPEKPAVYDFHNQLPDMKGGVHFCLHNNLWLTNFRAWYNDDALFRFKITF